MRTPPADLDPDALTDALRAGWAIDAAAIEHQPVGFGSYHWIVEGGSGRWWVTVDDLAARRSSPDQSLDVAFADLRGAMQTVRDLGDRAARYVVAPVLSSEGDPVVRIDERFAVVVLPVVAGRTHEWGAVLDAEQRAAVVEVLALLHSTPIDLVVAPPHDPRRFDHRDLLEAVAASTAGQVADAGPYAAVARELITAHAAPLQVTLARFDRLIGAADPARTVLTHGEPHPGNLIDAGGQWLLVDWDTIGVAPPERDLWMFGASAAHPDPGDGGRAVFERYEAATGVELDPDLLEAYRLRWDLADAAEYVRQLRAPHAGSADDDQAWANLRLAVSRLTGFAPRR